MFKCKARCLTSRAWPWGGLRAGLLLEGVRAGNAKGHQHESDALTQQLNDVHRSTFAPILVFVREPRNRSAPSLESIAAKQALRAAYFFFAGAGAAGGFAGAGLTITVAAGGKGLFALANSRLTCHICSSLRTWSKEGMPVSRIPLATFQ